MVRSQCIWDVLAYWIVIIAPLCRLFFYWILFLQLCITLNNISHVSGYLSKLSSLLHWDIVAQQLSVKHENEAVGQTTLRSLDSLVSATNDDVTVQSRVLSQRIIEKIVVDMKKYTIAFTRCHNGLPSVSLHHFSVLEHLLLLKQYTCLLNNTTYTTHI